MKKGHRVKNHRFDCGVVKSSSSVVEIRRALVPANVGAVTGAAGACGARSLLRASVAVGAFGEAAMLL